jgi:non-specific protein-tyrosine kinase
MELLRQYIKPLFRWWWLIMISTAIAGGTSYYVTRQQPPTYQTSTTLLVGQVIQKTDVTGADFFLSEQLAESYAQIAVRQPVLQATIDGLGLELSWQDLRGKVYVQSIPRTQLLVIYVSDTDYERTQAIANEVAYQLILQSPNSPENRVRGERRDFVTAQLDDLEDKIERAQVRIKELETELASALSARQIQDLQTEVANLDSLINGWQASYKGLLDFLQGGDSPNYLTVIEAAQPAYRIGPNTKLNVALAAAVGFALAVAAAFVLEFIDDTLKTGEDWGRLAGVTLLGSINRLTGKDYPEKLVTKLNPFAPASETYRLLRSNLQFMNIDKPAKTILITSSNPGEGKSTTAANLGVVMAQADLKTVIVDADLRRPTMHKIFDLPNLGGLTDLLVTSEPEVENYWKKSGINNLSVITSGPLPPNPSEMLSSQRMAHLLNRLENVADVIIIDSPPVLAVSDAVALANRVDGTILVTMAGRTRVAAIRHSISTLQQVGANMLGAILNGVTTRQAGYYYRNDYYTRSTVPSQSGGARWRPRWSFLKKRNDYA